MKRLLIAIAIVLLSVNLVATGYCGTHGGVTDTNDCEEGQILVGTGRNTGARSEGTWVDADFLKGEKGDDGADGKDGTRGLRGYKGCKGNTGADGTNGIDGINGQNGINGVDGIDGQDGAKGDKGDTGARGNRGYIGKTGAKGERGYRGEKGDVGARGLRGYKGDKGNDGIDGLDGTDGELGETGQEGADGADGEQGEKGDKPKHEWKGTELRFEDIDGTWGNYTDLQGEDGVLDERHSKQIDENTKNITTNTEKINDLDDRVGELEQTQVVVEGQVRIIDTRKWKVKPFVRYNFTRNKVDVMGVKVTFKMGKSYEETRIEELEAKLNALVTGEYIAPVNEISKVKPSINNGAFVRYINK